MTDHTKPTEAMIEAGVREWLNQHSTIEGIVAAIYLAMQSSAPQEPVARELECICHLQEHGHDPQCPRCLADIAGLQKPVADDDAEWVPRIGEKVLVISNKEWASDWVDPAGQSLELWVAAIRAIPGGGCDVTVSEAWPLKAEKLFGSSSLTDGFIVGRKSEQNDLAPANRLSAKAPETGEG